MNLKLNYLLKKIFYWSWVLTLPVSIFYFYWLIETADQYYSFAVKYCSNPVTFKLYNVGQNAFLTPLLNINTSLYEVTNKNNKDKIKTIQIYVPESDIAKLNSDLPHSGYNYVKGGLLVEDKIIDVKLRYRGDFAHHWAFNKKSWRIKTSKSNLYEGLRTFNLIAPKFSGQIEDYLGYRFAELMGLIAPKAELVNLKINGEHEGVYTLVEQLEEMTLRRHRKMPGDLYVGELYGKDFYTIGEIPLLFKYPSLWQKASINNHYPESSRKPLEKLISLCSGTLTEEKSKELTRLLDMEAWGRFSAFETLANTLHFDDLHNWRLYYDPAKEKFVPVVWDAGFNDDFYGLYLLSSLLHRALCQNGDFLRERQRAIRSFYEEGKAQAFLNELQVIASKIKPQLMRDPALMILQEEEAPKTSEFEPKYQSFMTNQAPFRPRRLVTPTRAIESMESFNKGVAANFSLIKNELISKDQDVLYAHKDEGVLSIQVGEKTHLESISLEFETLNSRPDQVKIRHWLNDEMVETDVTGSVVQRGRSLHLRTALLPDLRLHVPDSGLPQVEAHPAYYEILLKGVEPARLNAVRTGCGDGNLQTARKVKKLTRRHFATIRSLVKASPSQRPVIWSGEILQKSAVNEITSDLIIRPGTTIRLEPGATVVVTGRLLAAGTAEAPIRFVPAREGQEPWGAIVLKGEGSNGSRLSYCEFNGGSGRKGDLFEYSAMFSVHDVKGVEVERCRFSDSRETDDMVHAVYSEIRFSDSEFFRSKADALDLDISKGIVERCRFIDSGNDALDLMTTEAVVLDTELRNSGDKGISVGEGSTLLAMNDRFVGNVIGVQAKDGSVATLYNVDLAENGKALDAYKKNWRYNDGGRIFLYKGRFVKNTEMVTADKKSRIRLYDSYTDREIVAKKKRIRIDESVDSGEMTRARQAFLWRDPDEVKRLSAIDERHWSSARPEARGASLGR